MIAAVYVNRAHNFVCFDDDTILPVTNWLDADGDECEADEAVVYVAGCGGLFVTGPIPRRRETVH